MLPKSADMTTWPRWSRRALVGASVVMLCSCHSTSHHGKRQGHSTQAAQPGQTLPAEAYTGAPLPSAVLPDGQFGAPWRPPGIPAPWPHGEYLRDGGDFILPASVRADDTPEGLDQEDTIAHYDTLDGETEVVPSNRVHIYAPRFAAVRRVERLEESAGERVVTIFENPVRPTRFEDRAFAATSTQPLQPVGQAGLDAASTYRGRQQGGGLDNVEMLAGFQRGFMPYENFQLIREGIFEQAEKARLAVQIQNAVSWSKDQQVQVMLSGEKAISVALDVSAGTVYRIEEKQGHKLRLIKIASTDTAKPGETVDFTLRFDNVGAETIGRVTILDNLSTRLEYVPETAQSSLDAAFSTQPNEGGSQVLRWDLVEPLEPGDGGLIRFGCKVR